MARRSSSSSCFASKCPTLLERSLRNQIVFGSNYPRVEIKNMVKAIKSLGLTEACLEKILRTNAEKLLGIQTRPAR